MWDSALTLAFILIVTNYKTNLSEDWGLFWNTNLMVWWQLMSNPSMCESDTLEGGGKGEAMLAWI